MNTWTNYTPQQAADLKLDLSVRLDISAPINEMGERCPWPWEPQQLIGTPIGQYHCPYCGGMVVAGQPHLDWRDFPDDFDEPERDLNAVYEPVDFLD